MKNVTGYLRIVSIRKGYAFLKERLHKHHKVNAIIAMINYKNELVSVKCRMNVFFLLLLLILIKDFHNITWSEWKYKSGR